MKKIYYRIKFTNESALNLSNGENNNTDKDICRNSSNKPYIPGTSLAGVYRALFDKNEQELYFGKINLNGKSERRESKIVVYDANIEGKYSVSIRDCVSLDEFKTGISGAKLNFEVLDPKAQFITYIETDEEIIGDKIVNYWKTNGLSFGGKTQRGLGKCVINTVSKASFELPDDRWLDFDMYADEGWKKFEYTKLDSNQTQISLTLKQKSGISIRKYTTLCNKKDENNRIIATPDYEQLCYFRNGNSIPYIPGTTWSGAIRHRMFEINKSACESYFGSTTSKSNISFSDSEISNFKTKVFTRNAIDRFISGTKDGALYNERFVYDGTCELVISFKDGTDEFKNILAAAICDLHYGYLAIGGLTAVGRGLFEVKSINGKSIDDNIYQALLKEMER